MAPAFACPPQHSSTHADYHALLEDALQDQLPEQLDEDELEDNAATFKKDTKKDRRPVIYQHYHLDDSYTAPTVEHKKTPRPADKTIAWAVEQVVLAAPEKNTRSAYVPQAGKTRYTVSKFTVIGLRQWLEVRYAEYNGTPPHLSRQPIEFPVTEVGWTFEPVTRRFRHFEHGKDGNSIMNLIDAATRYCFPGLTYRMRWLITLEVVRFDVAGPAERTLSRLSSSYTTTGGTNQLLGGLSVASSFQLANERYLEVCQNSARQIQQSVMDDRNYMEARRDDLKDVKKTLASRKRLDGIRTEAESIVQQLKEDQEKCRSHTSAEVLQQARSDLMSTALAWCAMMRREMNAINDIDALADWMESL